jgi:dGTP triphosphohydrolase
VCFKPRALRKGIRVIQGIFEELLEDGDELLPWEHRGKMLSTLSNQEKTRICCVTLLPALRLPSLNVEMYF